MSWKVRLPMMCRLAFHTVSTVQAAASWSLSNTHLIPPSRPPTKPSIDMDIFKIRSLIASSLRWYDPRTGQIDQFRQVAIKLRRCRHRDHDKADALVGSARAALYVINEGSQL